MVINEIDLVLTQINSTSQMRVILEIAKILRIWSIGESSPLLTQSMQFFTIINPLLKFPKMNSATTTVVEMLCRTGPMLKHRKLKV